jgi:hypothetical protein
MADSLCTVDQTTTTVQRRCIVRFDLAMNTLHEITPYSEVYGVHPRSMEHFDKHVETASCSFLADPEADTDDDGNDDDDEQEEDIQPSFFRGHDARHRAEDICGVEEADQDLFDNDGKTAILEDKSLQNEEEEEDKNSVEEGAGLSMSMSLQERLYSMAMPWCPCRRRFMESMHLDKYQVGTQCGMHRNQRAESSISELYKEAKMTCFLQGFHFLRQMFALRYHSV